MASRPRPKENPESASGTNPFEAAYRALFDAFDDDGSQTLSRAELVRNLHATGILEDDPRIQGILDATRDGDGDGEREIGFPEFVALIQHHSGLLQRAMRNSLIVPDFLSLTEEIDRIHHDLLPVRAGRVADCIPRLARIDPEQFAISLCTVDGQRHSVGDADVPFCVQSVSETVSYCMALEEHGVDTGVFMSCALIRPELSLADRFDHVARTWQRLAGGRRVGFDNSVHLSERQTADRDFALGHSMRESKAFPPGTDLLQTLEFHFRCCSIELDARMLAVVAATFANGGVCPLTGDRVFSQETVRHCLSLMSSCGMYDFSGEFAFTVGLPAKSGVSGALMVVVPGLMGVCVWSPRLDELGNSVRGIEFCRQLVKKFEVHPYASVSSGSRRKNPRKRRDQSAVESAVALCWAAGQGDLDEVRRLASAGADISTGDYDGRTPLHLAAAEGHVEVAGYLLAHGADPGATDRWGGTALTDARRGGHTHVAELLGPHTAVPRQKATRSDSGSTAASAK